MEYIWWFTAGFALGTLFGALFISALTAADDADAKFYGDDDGGVA